MQSVQSMVSTRAEGPQASRDPVPLCVQRVTGDAEADHPATACAPLTSSMQHAAGRHRSAIHATPCLVTRNDACSQPATCTADLAIQTALSSEEDFASAAGPATAQHDISTQTPSRPAKRKLHLSSVKHSSIMEHRPAVANDPSHTVLGYGQEKYCSNMQSGMSNRITPLQTRPTLWNHLSPASSLIRQRDILEPRSLQNKWELHTTGSGLVKRQRRPTPSSMLSASPRRGTARAPSSRGTPCICELHLLIYVCTSGIEAASPVVMYVGPYSSGIATVPAVINSSRLSAAQLAHAPPSMVRQVLSTSFTGTWPTPR